VLKYPGATIRPPSAPGNEVCQVQWSKSALADGTEAASNWG